MSFEVFMQKAVRHPWLAFLGSVQTFLVFGLPIAIIALDAFYGVMRTSAQYDQLFVWWPYAMASLVATVVWFEICEIEPLVQIIYLLPRLLFFSWLYLMRYVPIIGAFFVWLDKED